MRTFFPAYETYALTISNSTVTLLVFQKSLLVVLVFPSRSTVTGVLVALSYFSPPGCQHRRVPSRVPRSCCTVVFCYSVRLCRSCSCLECCHRLCQGIVKIILRSPDSVHTFAFNTCLHFSASSVLYTITVYCLLLQL